MQARVLFILGAVGLLVLQVTITPLMEIGNVRPDFYVLFTVILVGILPPGIAMTLAFGLGLLRDLMIAAAPVGVDAFALLCAAGVLAFAHRRFLLESSLAQGAAAILGGLVHGSVWALALADSPGQFARLFFFTAVPAALYTGACMPVFARIASRFMEPRRRRIRLS